MRPHILVLKIIFLVTFNAAAYAECLKVNEPRVEIDRAHANLVTARWVAEVKNECDSPYDATLRVKFFVVGGYSGMPHETVDFIILNAGEAKEADLSINLPVNELSEIDRTEVDITERKRPL